MGHPKPRLAAPETPELRHNAALDGIRGLAILMVLGRHLIYISTNIQSPVYSIARGVKDSLFCGVDVFFALSGFLITRILIQTVSDKHFFRSFYARRALRIFPLYYGVLLLLFACTSAFHIDWRGDQWRLLTYSNRLFPDHAGEPWHFYYGGLVNLVNFWSLHIEEQFYMLWPLFVFFLRTPKRLLSAAVGLSLLCLGLRLWLYAHGFSQEFIYTSLITRMDSLLIGACLALALRTKLHALVLRFATPVFILATILFVADLSLQRSGLVVDSALFPFEFTMVSIAATMLIAMCLKLRSRTAHVFRSPILRFFGKYSYGLYIFHSILPMFYLQQLKSMTQQLHSHALGNVINSSTELIVALGVSMLSYRYFEVPFLKLKRFFPAYRDAEKSGGQHQPAATVPH